MGFFENLFGSNKPGPTKSQAPDQETPSLDDHEPGEKTPPSPGRTLARARVLAAVVGRATLEEEVVAGEYSRKENDAGRRRLLSWIKQSALTRELEPDEAAFLSTPVGRASRRSTIDASWRSEGLSVLLWALGRFELPRYDESSAKDVPFENVAFLTSVADADLFDAPALRSDFEISRFASHITIVGWRLTQFRARRDSELYLHASQELAGHTGIHESMDFVGYLRKHPRFKEYWLNDLRFIDDDLAIGDESIASAPCDHVKTCTSITTERQIAVYWLQGDDERYSRVSPATFLTSC
jgi:Domain of unknown function (DUF4272)